MPKAVGGDDNPLYDCPPCEGAGDDLRSPAVRTALVRVGLVSLCTLLLGGSVSAAPSKRAAPPRTVTVLTYNVFLGTDLNPIFQARSVQQLFGAVATGWAQIQANDFRARARAIARLIAQAKPDLVGLQEAELYRTQTPPDGPLTPATRVAYDYVAILLAALRARGAAYRAVVLASNVDAELPAGVPAQLDVRLNDRVAILARVERKPRFSLSSPQVGHFATRLTVQTVGGPILVPRGWASVDVQPVGGRPFRFVTTHLEAFSREINVAQGTELLQGPAATALPLVLVGDFNSRADRTGTPTYGNLVAGGLGDAWSERYPGTPGLTCCHQDDLRASPPDLGSRIDLVLTRGAFRPLRGAVIGEEQRDRAGAGGLWPSDHAGLWLTLRLPGR